MVTCSTPQQSASSGCKSRQWRHSCIHSTSALHAGEEPEDFYDSNGNLLNSPAVCLFWLNEAEVVEAARISSIQATLNNRLALAATAGASDLAEAITALQASSPEVAVVILADTGADPTNYPYLVGLQLHLHWQEGLCTTTACDSMNGVLLVKLCNVDHTACEAVKCLPYCVNALCCNTSTLSACVLSKAAA